LSLSCDEAQANDWFLPTMASQPQEKPLKATQKARHTTTRPVKRSAFVAWAAAWSLVTTIPIVGVTALTIGQWASQDGCAETNPVLDAGFFTDGAIIAVQFASQVRTPPRIAGVQQAALGSLALGAVGLIGNRIEPLVGALVLLGAVAVLEGLHPDPDDLLAKGRVVSLPLAGLAILAALVGTGHALRMLDLTTDAGPSCLRGQCVSGYCLTEMAVATVAVVLVGFLLAAQPRG